MAPDRIRSVGAWPLLALSILLALLAFLPWANWLGVTRAAERIANRAAVLEWLLWLAAVLPIALIITAIWGRRLDERLEVWREKLTALPATGFALAAAMVVALATALLSWPLFRHSPHLVDTIAQLFQARIFSEGSLTAPVPEGFEFFNASHLVRHGGRWFAQYPPGHPALLSIGLLLGAPWLVNPILAAGTVLLVYATGRRLIGEARARIAAALYAISPFALFMGASFMNHVTTGFFLALALYSVTRALLEDEGRWAILAGLALAAAASIRPLDAAAWAMALGAWIVYRRAWGSALKAVASGVLGVVPLLTYNALTTGAALRFGYTLLWGEGHGLGFHTDPWGDPFTPLLSFANTALDFYRLNAVLFGLPFPSLIFLIAGLALVSKRPQTREVTAVLAVLLLAAPLAYFFYWHRDNYLGPRFLYASLTPALLLSAIGIAALDELLGRWRTVLRVTLIAGVAYALAVKLPERAGTISGLEPELKQDPEVAAERLGVDEGLVFVKVGWGSRLIGRLWAWDISASETERAFRFVDGCRLQQALDEADSLVAVGVDSVGVRQGIRERLASWREMDLPVVKGLLPDAAVLADTTIALEARCALEAAFDATGYTLYGSLIWRQDPWLRRGIIYARDLGAERNRRLIAKYPHLEVFYYAPLSPDRGVEPVLRRYPQPRR